MSGTSAPAACSAPPAILPTGGAVTLRPVTAGPGGRLTAYQWNASSAWFDPARAAATFLVLATPSGSGLTAARAAATFGPPAATATGSTPCSPGPGKT